MTNNPRVGMLASILIIVALLAGTWFLGVSPKFSEIATANSERSTTEEQNAVHKATLDDLIELDQRLPELTADLAALRRAIPADVEMANYEREVDAYAAEFGVLLTAFSVGDSEPYVPGAEPLVDADVDAAKVSVNEDNFVVIPLQMNFSGSHDMIMNLMTRLQNGQRYFLLHEAQFEEGLKLPGEPSMASFSGQLFMLLDEGMTTNLHEAEPETAPAQ